MSGKKDIHSNFFSHNNNLTKGRQPTHQDSLMIETIRHPRKVDFTPSEKPTPKGAAPQQETMK